MASVYILKTKLGGFYIGSTTDLEKRLAHHRGGYTPSTLRLGVGELVLAQEYESLKDARSVEKKLKALKRKDYIEKMVQDGYIKLRP